MVESPTSSVAAAEPSTWSIQEIAVPSGERASTGRICGERPYAMTWLVPVGRPDRSSACVRTCGCAPASVHATT